MPSDQPPAGMTTQQSRLTRDRPIARGRAALLIIDVQNGTFSVDDKIARPAFYDAAASHVIPNIGKLLAAFRTARLEVIYTVIASLTDDGRDFSWMNPDTEGLAQWLHECGTRCENVRLAVE